MLARNGMQDLIYDLFNRGRLVISNYLHATEHLTLRLLRNRSVVGVEWRGAIPEDRISA